MANQTEVMKQMLLHLVILTLKAVHMEYENEFEDSGTIEGNTWNHQHKLVIKSHGFENLYEFRVQLIFKFNTFKSSLAYH